MAVLPTGFGKSIIYQSFDFANTASIVVVDPFRSIFQDQLQSKDFGLKAVAFKKIPQLLKDICANKYNVIFASARNKLCRQNSPQDALKWYNDSFPVVFVSSISFTLGPEEKFEFWPFQRSSAIIHLRS